MPRPIRKLRIPRGRCPGTGKLRFARNDAQSVLDRARNSDKAYRRECRIYECPMCGDWHLTSQEKRGD